MSKGNLFLGYARGKVGDVVFSHQYGEQIARARNRSPKNPQSPLQLLQRICFNTASKAFSYFQDICNHSFEGFAEGTPCQAEFIRLNVAYMREKLAYEIAFPVEDVMMESRKANYNQKGDALPLANAYIVSDGTLPSTSISVDSTNMYRLQVPYKTLGATPTYDDIIDGLGLQRGDQLTFLSITYNTSSTNPYLRASLTAFTYARVILSPSDGDYTSAFFTSGDGNVAVNKPNPSNDGAILFSPPSANAHYIGVNSINSVAKTGDDALAVMYPVLGAVIVSRQVNGRWLRSKQSLAWTRSFNSTFQNDEFRLAYASYKNTAGSSLYLNQSE